MKRLIFVMSILSAAAPAWGQPAEEPTEEAAPNEQAAREAFDRGAELAKEARWQEACPHFERAHELHPTGGTRLRLADCYEHTDRLIEARVLYREIIAGAATETVPERIDIARERLGKIDRLLEQKKPQPTKPTEPAKPTQPQPNPEPETPDEGLSPVPGAVLLGVGGAAVVLGAILGGLALSEEKEVRDTCNENNVCPGDQVEARDAARGKAISADICFGVGGAVAATGLVLLIVSVTGSSSEDVGVSRQGLFVRF